MNRKRKYFEVYKGYKLSLKAEELIAKAKRKGRIFWPSSVRGTYKRME